MPPGVIKGGTGMKLRVGELSSRYTPDFDAARAAEVAFENYVSEFEASLAEGWGGFTGTLVALEARQPAGVPEEDVMKPFRIRLAYEGSHWLTVEFELGRDEVGSTEHADMRMPEDLSELFETLGLPAPAPLPVIAVEHQIAQKLHACTFVNPRTGDNDRAHDLVDLQILEHDEPFDLAKIRSTATRLFAARGTTRWPPTVIAYENWETIYAEAANGLAVLATVDEAVRWANGLVGRIVEAEEPEARPA